MSKGTEKLHVWADLLLDTGKGNNLINFKDTKTGTAEIVYPDFATVFSRAEHSAVFEVYDPKQEDDEDYTLPTTLWDGESVEQKITKGEYLLAYRKKVKNRQILVYNSENKPIQALKNIGKKARSAMEETGVNIAYLAFGFIHWRENENAPTSMRAPILLAPVCIENESPVEPCYVRVTDDEVIVNPTFSFKLQNEFGVKLPEYDEDEGIEGYFLRIQDVVSRLKWTVTTECKIGTFSFLKINMYKDLKDNAPKIAQNACIRALLGEKVEQTDNERIPAPDLLSLRNVVDADSSQGEAIALAKAGESFVLQGPPGTGKSQTITNIIAECMSDGKKVLFVSEKLAALSVVYDKLKKVGLEEFCLELHSHKANKKQVIEELCHTLKLQKSGVSDKADREIRLKKEAQERLDEYAKELHAPRPIINKSAYRLFEEIAARRNAPTMNFVISDLPNKGEEYGEKAETALTRYAEYTESVGYDYRKNVWYGYVDGDYSYPSVTKLKAELQGAISLCDTLVILRDSVKDKYGVCVDGVNGARTLEKCFALLKDARFITPTLLKSSENTRVLELCGKMKTLAETVLQKKKTLDMRFDQDVYKLNGQELYKKLTRQYDGFFTRLFSKEYKAIAQDIRFCTGNGKKLPYKKAVSSMDDLCVYQTTLREFDELENRVKDALGKDYAGVNTDFKRAIDELTRLAEIHSENVDFARLQKYTPSEFESERGSFARFFDAYEKAFAKDGEAEKGLKERFDLNAYDTQRAPLDALTQKYRDCLDRVDELGHWCSFMKLLDELKALSLFTFVNKTIDKRIPAPAVCDTFQKTYYSQWADLVLGQTPALAEFARIPHDETVKRFKEKDNLHFDINKAKIKATLSAQRPSLDMIAQGSSIAILLREGEKKRKQKGIRQLLSEIGELAQTLKPCFLMSPLSVSTFLSPDIQFDVVVFDEASQIFPQDAVGAIYRGKQLIVVGDSKQMPPSNFFNSTADFDDSEEEDITDFESILDLCSTTFPQRRLKWHYRSRFERLISFSNENFYDGELVTFPSAQKDKKGLGVDYFYVDGVFDRTSKTNRLEAERVVELVFENIEKYPDRSIGVVAFSISQQTLIDKLITKRRRQDPSKDWFFKSDRSEPFFVKNLETVQGDERDVIIFSVAYAKDAQGKLLLNFGPVNRAGGERRLNVAVTRAKYNVQLVSSMHYGDIDISRTNSVGARLLQDYLDYAENGDIALTRATSQTQLFVAHDSDLEAEICDFLTAEGFEVEKRLGSSSFKVDLAVKRPNTEEYALAIECDGAAYRDAHTTRDRDRLQQEVMERMGWRYYRIWSTDWFANKRVEKERLLTAVKYAIAHPPKKESKGQKETTFEQAVKEKHFEFPKYEKLDENRLGIMYKKDVVKMTRAIVEKEAPVSEEWLLKRIVFAFGGREKVTGVVHDEFNKLMQGCERWGIVRLNGFLYLINKPVPMLRVPKDGDEPRDIKYIELQELIAGIKELLRRNVTVEKAGLFRLLASQLGFARAGEALTERMETALRLIKDEIEVNGEMLSLKKDGE